MPAVLVLQRRVDGGVDVPLDGREFRKSPGLDVGERGAHRRHDLRLVGQEVHGRAELPPILGQAGEAGQTAQREVDL